jgi:hypothetical protein
LLHIRLQEEHRILHGKEALGVAKTLMRIRPRAPRAMTPFRTVPGRSVRIEMSEENIFLKDKKTKPNARAEKAANTF